MLEKVVSCPRYSDLFTLKSALTNIDGVKIGIENNSNINYVDDISILAKTLQHLHQHLKTQDDGYK